MTFIHPLLLGGLILIGVPILLHLIMRQKPRHLLFPAVRFLLKRHQSNQRKLQLRHLLLLLMRMLLIACVCIALARPRVFSERLNLLSNDRPMAAVLIFDTSPSMEYNSGGKTRLDEAKRRGLELLGDLPDNSQVAVFDTADSGDEFRPVSFARERISALQIRPANYPITNQLARAYDLLSRLLQSQENPSDAPLPFIYVLSDRTQACWDFSQVENLIRLRDRVPPPGAHSVFVDVGIERPENLAIANLELPRQIIPIDGRVEIRATVSATGRAYDSEVVCRIDGEEAGRKPVQLIGGQSQVVTFEKRKPAPGLHQVEVALRASDSSLTFDDVRYATFEVRGNRKVLTLADDPGDALIWHVAMQSGSAFMATVKSTQEAAALGPKDLAAYQAVVLLGIRSPNFDLWQKLAQYVREGGGLAVIPGGSEMDNASNLKSYNGDATAQELLPATFDKTINVESGRGAIWNVEGFRHPVIAPFRIWVENANVDFFKEGREPAAVRYWAVTPRNADVIVSYSDAEKRPALLETKLDRQKFRGRVLMFTVPMDNAHSDSPKKPILQWHNYLPLFYLVLAQRTVGYLAGDAEEGNFNFLSGQSVPIPLPPEQRFPTYTIQGPGLTTAEAIVPRAQHENELNITKAVVPGNYLMVGGPEAARIAGFSLNIAPDETVLTRVPEEQIEALFGSGSVVPVDFKSNLREALLSRWSQPVEMFPWLMILLLLLLATENLLANKFYRQEDAKVEEEK